MRTDQRAPRAKILRTAKIHRMVFQGFPFDVQAVARRLFDGTVQLETFPALAFPEDGFRPGDRGLKILFAAGFDIDLCDFGDHGWASVDGTTAVSQNADRLKRGTPKCWID